MRVDGAIGPELVQRAIDPETSTLGTRNKAVNGQMPAAARVAEPQRAI
jgi:hypothetical protein